jgi:hypothetical protein
MRAGKYTRVPTEHVSGSFLDSPQKLYYTNGTCIILYTNIGTYKYIQSTAKTRLIVKVESR